MFIVHFYTALLFIFTGFLNNSYAMVIHSDKNQSHHQRSDRQLRPVLNGIIFLLAANLVAKGTLALGGYQSPNLPNNVQGALYLTLNGPQQNPNWFPISNQVPYVGVTTPTPITQQQIVNIRDPYYEDDLLEETPKPNPIQKIIFNRYNNLDDILPAASEEVKIKLDENKTEESTEYYEDDVELLPQSKQEEEEGEEDIEDNAKQQSTTTTAGPITQRPTLRPTQTPTPSLATEAAMTSTTTTATTITTASPNGTTESNQGYSFGYGPSNGNENVSITTAAPVNNNNNTVGGNVSDTLVPPSNNSGSVYGPPDLYGPPDMYGAPHVGPHYYPSGGYGPSNGNENISIAYGPPAHQQKPFFSSPADPYLNNYQHNNYYDNPTYYTDLYKYNDVFNRFYNKYQYNYPSFYNNYLGK